MEMILFEDCLGGKATARASQHNAVVYAAVDQGHQLTHGARGSCQKAPREQTMYSEDCGFWKTAMVSDYKKGKTYSPWMSETSRRMCVSEEKYRFHVILKRRLER